MMTTFNTAIAEPSIGSVIFASDLVDGWMDGRQTDRQDGRHYTDRYR